MIQAVLFDLGETLINFRDVNLYRAFAEGAKDSYDFLSEKLKTALPPFRQYKRHQLISVRWTDLKCKITGREFNSIDLLKKYARKCNISLPNELFDELAWKWYEPLANHSVLEKHAIETLQELQRRNLKLAIVSNTFVPASSLDKHLEREGLMEFFPVRIYSCNVGVRKPKKKIFNAALRKLDIPARNALFVGDSLRADIVGATRAGMFSVLKTDKPPHIKLGKSTFYSPSLDKIPGIIDRINDECLMSND